MSIAFDLDGVVIKIGEILQDEILKRLNYDIFECRHTYYINIPGRTPEENNKLIWEIVNSRGMEAKPYPGSIDALKELYQKTREELTFVTARDPEIIGDQTERWLTLHLGETPFRVIYVPRTCKSEWLVENKITVFVDDRFKNVNDIAEKLHACFLINRPWNEGREPRYNVIRVDSVALAIRNYLKSKERIEKF